MKSSYLCVTIMVVALLTACGQSKEEKTEVWETARRSAFQEFRDRRYEGSEASYLKALELAKNISPNGLEVIVTSNELAVVYNTTGKEAEAAKLYEQSLSALESLSNADNLNKDLSRAYCEALEGLAKIKEKHDDLAAAEALYSKAVHIAERADAPARLRELIYEYKSVLQREGKSKEAKALEQQTTAISDDTEIANRESYLREQAELALARATRLMAENRTHDADTAYQEAFSYARQSKDPKFRGDIEGQIAWYLYTTHNLVPAESAIIAALHDWREAQVDDEKMLTYLVTYSAIESSLRKFDSAEKAADLALKIAKAQFPGKTMQMQQAMSGKVSALMGQQRYKEAIPYYEESYEILKLNAPLASTPMIMQTCWLSNAYWLNGQKQKAENLVATYADTVSKSRSELNLVSRLLNDFGDEQRRTGEKEQALLYYNASMKLAKRAPDAAGEVKRAQDGIKASQTRAAT